MVAPWVFFGCGSPSVIPWVSVQHLVGLGFNIGHEIKPIEIEHNLLANKPIEIEQNLYSAFVFLTLRLSFLWGNILALSFWGSDPAKFATNSKKYPILKS